MRVLLTGAGGFVGHHTLSHLLKTTDWDFVVTDSFRHFGTSARLRAVFDEIPSAKDRIKIVIHDLSIPLDFVTLEELGEVEIIINMASQSHVERSIEQPRSFIENNVSLAINVLEVARSLPNLRTFIQISTDEVYGPARDGLEHKEWSRIIPSNPYSASKAAQEAICIAYWRSYGIPLVITNTMNIIGERQDVEKFVPKTIATLLNGKKVPVHGQNSNGVWKSGSRFYLHARNQADALRFLIKEYVEIEHTFKEGVRNLPPRYNVRGEQEVNNVDLVRMIAEDLDIDSEDLVEQIDVAHTRPGHDLRYALDGDSLFQLGWKPPVPFQESLRRVVRWTVKNPQWLRN